MHRQCNNQKAMSYRDKHTLISGKPNTGKIASYSRRRGIGIKTAVIAAWVLFFVGGHSVAEPFRATAPQAPLESLFDGRKATPEPARLFIPIQPVAFADAGLIEEALKQFTGLMPTVELHPNAGARNGDITPPPLVNPPHHIAVAVFLPEPPQPVIAIPRPVYRNVLHQVQQSTSERATTFQNRINSEIPLALLK